MGLEAWMAMFILSTIALSTATFVSNKPKCYQCKVEHNDLCTDDYLKICPDDQAYDRCMTTISKTKSSFLIEKKCALGPCKLRDPKQTTGLGLDHCDRSRPEYSCVQCCQGDGCNRNEAANVHPAVVTFFFLLFLTMGMFLFLRG
ncbi:uncharacterized protein LOC111088522 [Limulus polyphemus]|uniref:Uncharacterized protein LOC111088522 n=1 Tax=Limulus polyphemus TaxID=6850 RepID=A0ABM1TFJ4_LIMPO|nr:uncharacterized protein LOC111088522 [Limulus polyphemus]